MRYWFSRHEGVKENDWGRAQWEYPGEDISEGVASIAVKSQNWRARGAKLRLWHLWQGQSPWREPRESYWDGGGRAVEMSVPWVDHQGQQQAWRGARLGLGQAVSTADGTVRSRAAQAPEYRRSWSNSSQPVVHKPQHEGLQKAAAALGGVRTPFIE